MLLNERKCNRLLKTIHLRFITYYLLLWLQTYPYTLLVNKANRKTDNKRHFIIVLYCAH